MRDPTQGAPETWLRPWRKLQPDEGAALERELQKEVGPMHPLWGLQPSAVGRREDNDDVLFATGDAARPLAVVHLTWTGRPERTAHPYTVFFESWSAWVDECMRPDAD